MNLAKLWEKKSLFFISILIFILYIGLLFIVTENYSQSLEFSDENAHLVAGYFMNKGYTLYRDIAMNHQPLIYFFSSLVQKVFAMNSLFLFIKRHREFVYLYAVIWNTLLFFSFGWTSLVFMFIFSAVQFFLLGNLFLGETFAVYPFLYMTGTLIQKLILDKKVTILQTIIFSISSFIIAFSLIPLWGSVALMNATLLYLHRNNKKLIVAQLVPVILFTITLFIFVPLRDYFLETIYYNYHYLYPVLKKPIGLKENLSALFLPLSSISLNPNTLQLTTIVLTVVYGFNIYVSYRLKKLPQFLLLTIFIILANTRVSSLYEEYYQAFHVLPWFGAYTLLQSFYFQTMRTFHLKKKYLYVPHVLVIGLLFWLYFFGDTPFTVKKNTANENYIGYSYDNTMGLGIKAIKREGDRAAVFPHEPLINWVSQTELPTRLLEHYDWSYKINRNYEEFKKVFAENPPEFVVINGGINRKLSFQTYLLNVLKKNYIQVKHTGKPSGLYILKSKLPEITEDQWKEFEYLQFARPAI